MTEVARPERSTDTDAEGDVAAWTSHPIRDEPLPKTALLTVVILGLTAAVYASFPGPIYAALTFGLLTACMSRYFAPTRFECGPEGVVVSHLGRRRTTPWTSIGRAVTLSDGLFLSPFPTPSRLDRFRGQFLPCPANRDAVAACVRSYLQDDTESDD